jgi:hypothetical protein
MNTIADNLCIFIIYCIHTDGSDAREEILGDSNRLVRLNLLGKLLKSFVIPNPEVHLDRWLVLLMRAGTTGR